jgi:hypothetical protein
LIDGASDDEEDEWRIDSGLKVKIALEALREQATVADLAQGCEVSRWPMRDFQRIASSPTTSSRPAPGRHGHGATATAGSWAAARCSSVGRKKSIFGATEFQVTLLARLID